MNRRIFGAASVLALLALAFAVADTTTSPNLTASLIAGAPLAASSCKVQTDAPAKQAEAPSPPAKR